MPVTHKAIMPAPQEEAITDPVIPSVIDQPAPMRARDLTNFQRATLLIRVAEDVIENRKPILPRGIDLKDFLKLFDRDSTVDVAASNVLCLREPATRHGIAIIVANDCGIVL